MTIRKRTRQAFEKVAYYGVITLGVALIAAIVIGLILWDKVRIVVVP